MGAQFWEPASDLGLELRRERMAPPWGRALVSWMRGKFVRAVRPAAEATKGVVQQDEESGLESPSEWYRTRPEELQDYSWYDSVQNTSQNAQEQKGRFDGRQEWKGQGNREELSKTIQDHPHPG